MFYADCNATAWIAAQPLPTHVKNVLGHYGITSEARAHAVLPHEWKAMRNLGKKGYALVQAWLRGMDPERYLSVTQATVLCWYFPFDEAA